jgi:eukaryotic-like serine/threonine-protein kinase
MSHNPEDYLISRPHFRSQSLVIEASAAEFLEQFRSPKTIVEAVIDHSNNKGLSAEEVLEDVMSLVSRTLQLRLLAVQGSIEAEKINPTLSSDYWVANYKVISCIHIFNDVEVYKVIDTSGREYALKILRPLPQNKLKNMIEREAAVLQILNGIYTPSLISRGSYQERPYLVMTWCNGKNIANVANDLRGSTKSYQYSEIIELCLNLLRTYSWLHGQGILHGDVHPKNIRVAEDGSITLLDFGLGCSADDRYELSAFARGGVAEYMDPEYCYALEHHEQPPSVTIYSEQYSIAALCYFLLTGYHYLNFSLEKAKWILQVMSKKPLFFTEYGLPSRPAVEQTLMKALAKSPLHRFASLSEFTNEMEQALKCNSDNIEHKCYLPHNSILESVIERFGRSGFSIRTDLLEYPKCSINYGASGIAYFFYRIAGLRDDANLLSTADIWSSWSMENITRPGAFNRSKIDIAGKTVETPSLYHSEIGVYFVQALISHAMGDFYSADKAARAFVAASKRSSDNNLDLTMGRSGVLLGCAILMEAFAGYTFPRISEVRNLGETTLAQIMGSIINEKICYPKVVSYLGIAHGWAGILYAALRWQQANKIIIAGLEDKLHELGDLGRWGSSIITWPVKLGSSAHDYSVTGWCHGSAGYVHLWTLAYQVLGDQRFLHLAEGVAKHVWKSIDIIKNMNGSMCCGYTGQGYALLSLYRTTKNKRWLQGAHKLYERAVVLAHKAERRASLYKGDLGIALLAAELSYPELSCTPVFESERWGGATCHHPTQKK